MNYTLNQLNIFLKIAQTQSVTKAAEELHLTQPAVSIQLKNFQDQFDIPLTEVVGRNIYITDFGKEIAEAAKNILSQIDAIDHKTHAYKGLLSGKLKISVVSTGKYIMPYFLADFVKEHPGIELIMDVTNKQSVVKSLEDNQVDFSLVSILPDNLNTEAISLMQNKLFLVGNKKLDIKKGVNPKEVFKDLPLIYREEGSGTRLTMQRYFEQNEIPVKKKMELTSNEAVKQALIAGLGYSIMPLIGIKNELTNGDLHITPIKGLPIKTIWNLIWLKGKKHSPAAQALKEHIEQHREDIMHQSFNWYEKY